MQPTLLAQVNRRVAAEMADDAAGIDAVMRRLLERAARSGTAKLTAARRAAFVASGIFADGYSVVGGQQVCLGVGGLFRL